MTHEFSRLQGSNIWSVPLLASVAALTLLIVGCSNGSNADRGNDKSHPHIVVILADDLGWGDVRAYNGDSRIPTPNIDSLAESGMRFTDAHSSASVCSPTRYGLLTGRYSWRTRLKRGVLWPPDRPLIDSSRTTMPEILDRAGYYTSIVGKWHLGLGWQMAGKDSVDYSKPLADGPNDHGFDDSFIFAGSSDMKPYTFVENGMVTRQPTGYAPAGRFGQKGPSIPGLQPEDILPRFTKRAKAVIDRHAENRANTPLFLYFPLTAPHKPVAPAEQFQGTTPLGDYGDFVYQVDWTVGEIVDQLRSHGMFSNTLLIVTSDNGTSPNAAEQAIEKGHDVNGPYRGLKATIWEGGHRVPFIATWPGHIQSGVTIDERISLVDLTATFASLTNVEIDSSTGVDSYDLMTLFDGRKYESPIREATVVRSGGGCLAILKQNWKLANCPGSGSGWAGTPTTGEAKQQDLPPVQLYDLWSDVSESNNLQQQRTEKVDQLQNLLKSYINRGRSTPGPAQKNWKNRNSWEQLNF